MAKLDLRENFRERRPQLEGKLVKIWVNCRENGFVQIGAQLPEDLKTKLTELLKQNANLFAWVPVGMLGIDMTSFPTN